MKYGLLTIHATQNYGSFLQTYSTYKALEKIGLDVELIDYRNQAITNRETPITEKKIKSLKNLLRVLVWGKDQKRKTDNMDSFLKENAIVSPRYDIDSVHTANERYDAFVVGSDIVWGTKITGSDMTYFLNFADDSKYKVAFSSSAGTKWTEAEQQKIKPLLEKFNAISVREQLTADWIREITGLQVPVTCDPTMLWDTSFWKQFLLKDYAPKEKYVLIYAINPDKKNIKDGVRYAKKHGMKAYFIHFYSHMEGTKTIHPVTINQWITLFANAEVVFSASYHGLLFSMYFHRNVFYYNRGEKSRMISLGEELQITHREGTDDNLKNNIPIDYKFVDAMMEKKRTESWNYLKKTFCGRE